MSAITYLNFTVRRVDRMPISQEDIDFFADFIDEEMISNSSSVEFPQIATDHKAMCAFCEWYGIYEESDMMQFAEAHPEYQIELIEECSECDSMIRCLYQGDIMEMTTEVRYFPDPQRIPWKYGE